MAAGMRDEPVQGRRVVEVLRRQAPMDELAQALPGDG